MISQDSDSRLFHPLEDALSALRSGQLVIVIDAKDRENEGDFVCAAEKVTPEIMDIMLRRGAGVLCAPLVQEAAERLALTPIVDNTMNTAPNQTNFLTQIDHCKAGSGVSAANRTRTLRSLSEPEGCAAEFVRPGHIWPLLAKDGGVLRRAGHTEATVDLLKMAGMTPVGALIEICSQRGTGMADLAELQELSDRFRIPMISIEQVIQYRCERERLVKREVDVPFESQKYGRFNVIGYSLQHDNRQPIAIVWGDLSTAFAPLVHLHSSCFTGDLLDSLRCDCGDQLHTAMQMIHAEGTGAVVYLPQEGRGTGMMEKLKAHLLQDLGDDTLEANQKRGLKPDARDDAIGQQILKDLGLSNARFLTNNPQKVSALAGFDATFGEQNDSGGHRLRDARRLTVPL